jgi:hypothetical protein
MTNNFSTIAYAKLKIDFDHELFAEEYDQKILPNAFSATNSIKLATGTSDLNNRWGMVPKEVYDTGDVFDQPGDAFSFQYIKRERPCWKFAQLMQLDLAGITNKYIIAYSNGGATHFRNETIDEKYKFYIKEQYRDLKIWQWIQNNLPFKKINDIHCVSIEPNGFSLIHRDNKGLYDSSSSAGESKIFKNGYVVINLNISNGGVPLYWGLDGKEVVNPHKADEPVYITNDYFLHGVPVVESRRRQIRVMGIPKDEMWDLIDHNDKIDIGPDYKFGFGA